MSKRTFNGVDYDIFSSLCRWARRRHPKKNQRWIKEKYFEQRGTRNWIFTGEMRDDQGQPFKVWLLSASATPIRRHVKVRSDANPYDPAYETYFEKREEDHMRDTFQGSRFLRFLGLNNAASALCAIPKSLASPGGACIIAYPA